MIYAYSSEMVTFLSFASNVQIMFFDRHLWHGSSPLHLSLCCLQLMHLRMPKY